MGTTAHRGPAIIELGRIPCFGPTVTGKRPSAHTYRAVALYPDGSRAAAVLAAVPHVERDDAREGRWQPIAIFFLAFGVALFGRSGLAASLNPC